MKEVTKDRNFFKVNRSILAWEWFDDAKTLQVWIYLLANAAYSEKKWRGIDIGVGDVITSRTKIAAACGMSEQNVRTCLKRLKSTNEITIKTTKHFSRITLTNYAKYQGIKVENKVEEEEMEKSESTNSQPTTNQQPTSNISKKVKKEKKDDDDLELSLPRARTDSKLKIQLENDIERLRSLAKKHKVNDGVIADMIESFYDWYSSCREDAKNYTYLCTAFDNWLLGELKKPGGESPAAEPDPAPLPPTDNQPANQPTEPKKFVKPTIEEVDAEIKRRGYTDIDAVMFWNFYESKGWKVGDQPMKKWQACLTTWYQREKKKRQEQQNKQQYGQPSNLPAPARSNPNDTINRQCTTVETNVNEVEDGFDRELADIEAYEAQGGYSPYEEISSQAIS